MRTGKETEREEQERQKRENRKEGNGTDRREEGGMERKVRMKAEDRPSAYLRHVTA